MTIEEIKETLKEISFAPSNLDMGWTFQIKTSKIYDDDIVLEKGFVIRTTFMRPDILTGEMDKGYGRWMYIPENISKDDLVKHELMEAFLYEIKRIFDPHKSLKDLQVNGRRIESSKKEKVEEVVDEKIKESDKIFHEQNSGNHIQEVKQYLDTTYQKKKIKNENVKRYTANGYYIDLHILKNGLTLAKPSGEVVEALTGDKYTLSNLKEILDKHGLIASMSSSDPGEINELIIESGFTEVSKKDSGSDVDLNIWKYINPKNSSRYILHSETNKFVSLVNDKHDILSVVEDDDYNYDNVKKLLN